MLSPVINTEVKMPKKMMEALTRFETICAVTNVKEVAESDVRSFLVSEYGEAFANKFDVSYLFSSR